MDNRLFRGVWSAISPFLGGKALLRLLSTHTWVYHRFFLNYNLKFSRFVVKKWRRRCNFFQNFIPTPNFFLVFGSSIAGFRERRNFSPELISSIRPRMNICPCSWTVGISKKIWIQTHFGLVMIDSEEVFRHFAFWRHGSRLATFFIATLNCIFGGASFEPIRNLATLDPEKLQGFHGTPLYHCYTLWTTRLWPHLSKTHWQPPSTKIWLLTEKKYGTAPHWGLSDCLTVICWTA